MVGLVHDQQIPARFPRLPGPFRIGSQEIEAAEYQLVIEKWIGHRLDGVRIFLPVVGFSVIRIRSQWRRGLNCEAPLLVKDIEPQVELAEHLHKPLVHQGFRNQDKDACRTTGSHLTMNDKARLNRLAQANLVGKQHPWGQAAAYLTSHMKLVGNKINPAAQESTQG